MNSQRERPESVDLYSGSKPWVWAREAFQELVRTEISRSYREKTEFSVVMTEIDGYVTEQDDMLVYLASHIKSQCRDEDILGLYGDGSFAVMLPGADIVEGVQVGERIRSSWNRYCRELKDYGKDFGVTSLSVGSALFLRDGSVDDEELLARAEKATRWAKEAGGNRVKIYIKTADREV